MNTIKFTVITSSSNLCCLGVTTLADLILSSHSLCLDYTCFELFLLQSSWRFHVLFHFSGRTRNRRKKKATKDTKECSIGNLKSFSLNRFFFVPILIKFTCGMFYNIQREPFMTKTYKLCPWDAVKYITKIQLVNRYPESIKCFCCCATIKIFDYLILSCPP